MPFNLGTGELFVLGIVALLVFGGNLPQVARKAGNILSEFRRGMREEMRKVERMTQESEPEPEPPKEWAPPPDGEECEGLN
jgi:sec-independent protein translocase protein TatA